MCDHSDEDGWGDTDNSGKDTTRFDSAIPGMWWSKRLCLCPPRDTEDKMNTQTEEGPSGVVGRASRVPFFRVVLAAGEGG